jgi:membrane protease YdiL (CAAX protease family)
MADFFYNDAGRLRSVWRLAAFLFAACVVYVAILIAARFVPAFFVSRETYEWLLDESAWGWIIQSVVVFVPAAVVGWVCASSIEDLPWRSLGWALHRGWLRDMLMGTLVGGVSVCLAALVGAVAGGYSFAVGDAGGGLARTLLVSAVVFLLGSAAEEMLFRGYALQTLMRSWPLWVALLPASVFFAAVHLGNPNVARGVTFVNTVLAGVWLGVAYWKTRSLWLPTGLHFGWNWVQGALLGSPVSGITQITPDPLLRFTSAEPFWLGGGKYGIEGGAACTLALVVSTVFVWRARLFKADPELLQYTDGESPNPQALHVTPPMTPPPAGR